MVDPDLRYCIQITDLTTSTTLHLCEIYETEFNFTLPPDNICHEYNITVTPQHDVVNGTQSSRLLPVAEQCELIIIVTYVYIHFLHIMLRLVHSHGIPLLHMYVDRLFTISNRTTTF